MAEKTDYTILLWVALVAACAVAAMFLYTQHASGLQLEGMLSLTGFAVATPEPVLVARSEQHIRVGSRSSDYDGDGAVTESDVAALSAALRTGCPALWQCDVQRDGVFDERDIGALSAHVLSLRVPAEGEEERKVAVAAPAARALPPFLK